MLGAGSSCPGRGTSRSNNELCYWALASSGGKFAWENVCLGEGQASAQGTSPAALCESANGEQCLYYPGSNTALCLWGLQYHVGEYKWENACLGAGQAAAQGVSPAALREPTSGEQWVYYPGANGSLGYWVLNNDNGKFTWANV